MQASNAKRDNRSMRIILVVVLVAGTIAAVGAALLIRRGFSAQSEPSAFETAVARRIRNIAIPRSERQRKNPWNATPETLQDAREHFIARCAICHGNDGRGWTQIGRGLYPRVPDLLSPETQSLTDGELHYIIENGVQLTGMPAWGNPHQETDDDSWKLVLFIRGLRPLTAPRKIKAGPITTIRALRQARRLAKNATRRFTSAGRKRRWPTWCAIRASIPRPSFPTSRPTPSPSSRRIRSPSFTAASGSSVTSRKLATIISPSLRSGTSSITYGARISSPKERDWWVPFYPPDNMQRPTGPTCDGCHSVDYNIHTKQVAEWNVGCERCHGPGSEHVAHPRPRQYSQSGAHGLRRGQRYLHPVPLAGTSAAPIRSKGNITTGRSVTTSDYGCRITGSWKTTRLAKPAFTHFPDGTAHKNRMQGNDFVQSVMYRRGITCFSCHDAHGTDNYAQLRKPADKICLDCHGPLSPNGPRTATLEEHTHHKDGSPGSQCVACHMPKIETEGPRGDVKVHAHTFRFITPAMTDKYKIPNPCTSCHTDKSTAGRRTQCAIGRNAPLGESNDSQQIPPR